MPPGPDLPDGLTIAEDDLTAPDVRALVALHLSGMHDHSPPEKVHALPVAQLQQPGVTFYAARIAGQAVAIGALRILDAPHGEIKSRGEIKSMRVVPGWLGRGVGHAMLLHLLDAARARALTRVSLETGRGPAFAPALRLYRRHGFVPCAPFGDYVEDDFSQCLSLAL